MKYYNEDTCVKNIYREIEAMGEIDESILEKEEIYRRKPNPKQRLQIRWVNGLEYKKHPIHVLELKVERARRPYRNSNGSAAWRSEN